jgi:hypothetical protein
MLVMFLFLLNLFLTAHKPLPLWIIQMQGSWVMKKNNFKVYEHWYCSSDTLLYGNSYRVTEDGDSILIELLSIKYLNDTLYYIPVVSDQNDAKPVLFKLTMGSAQQVVFEKNDHDFPDKIEYRFFGNNDMKATVSGTYQDTKHTLEFNYKRIK